MSRTALRVLRAYSVGFAGLTLLPVASVFLASFTQDAHLEVIPSHWGFRWYMAAFEDASFLQAFQFSAVTASIVASLGCVVGLLAAMALRRYRFRGRDAIHSILMAPLMIPHILIALILLQLCARLRVVTSPYGLVAGQLIIVLPFVVRLLLAGLAGVDPMLEVASRSLGATRLTTFSRVLAPLIAPAVISALVVGFIVAFDESVVSLFLSVPGATTLPVEIFNYYDQRSDPLIAAVSALTILVAVVVIVVVDRLFGLLRLLAGGA